MEKVVLCQRMIQQFHEEIFQRMSPEARARKLSVMRALAKSMRAKNKENENPLNNNTSLPIGISLKQSTPLKVPQITDLDEIVSDSSSEILEEEKSLVEEDTQNDVEQSQLVYARVYDPDCESVEFGNVSESVDNDQEDLNSTVTREDKHWKSLEVLHENAEYEFCRSLEESKLYVSSASLLEEIEADLPPQYSLAKPLNYTFHTVSTYRTQTRLARMVRFGLPSVMEKDINSTCSEFPKPEGYVTKVLTTRLDQLETEVLVQRSLSEQAEKALNLSKSKKLWGVELMECEKALLLADLRFQAAVEELRKVKSFGDSPKFEAFGQITISDIYFDVDVFPVNLKEQFLCVAIERENVLCSSVMWDFVGGKFHFGEEFKFDTLRKNFVVTLHLYKLHVKEPKKVLFRTGFARKFERLTMLNTNRSIMYPHYGKSDFVLLTSAELRLDHITSRESGKCILLNTSTEHLDGSSVAVRVKTDIKTNFILSGFLNVFKHTWHRRWYFLSHYLLESWLYPEDRDTGKPPIESIYLRNCTSATPVDMEVCVRPNCFTVNLKSTGDKILFSAGSNSDMDQWVEHLNLIIGNILAWRPNI